MIADEHRVAGVICFGYPFHPPRQPQKLRIEHLATLRTPMLICQGERDPFGTRNEVGQYALSEAIRLHWLADGNHDLMRRGCREEVDAANLNSAVAASLQFISGLP